MICLGVDPATVCVAIADDDGRVASVEIPKGTGAKRLADIHIATQRLVWDFIGDDCPTVCFIESPAGKVHPSLWQAFGVISTAVWITLSTVERFPVTVLAIGPPEWKRVLLDNGGASKAQVMEWAVGNGYGGDSQDEADAYAIACAGTRLLKP